MNEGAKPEHGLANGARRRFLVPGVDPERRDATGMLGSHGIRSASRRHQQAVEPELLREWHPVPVVPGRIPFGGIPPGDDENLAAGSQFRAKCLDDVDHESVAARRHGSVGPILSDCGQPLQSLRGSGPFDSLVRHGLGQHVDNLAESETPLGGFREREMRGGGRIERRRQQADAPRCGQPARDRAYHYSR